MGTNSVGTCQNALIVSDENWLLSWMWTYRIVVSFFQLFQDFLDRISNQNHYG